MQKLSSIKIIGGKWGNSKINFINTKDLRPTPNRIRETLFNWLQFDIVGSTVLDLFAGSGSLAFEALSRGASSATLVEANNTVYKQLQKQLLSFDNKPEINIINQDFDNYINNNSNKNFDCIFLDPPFNNYNNQDIITKLLAKNIAITGSKIYIEDNSNLVFNNLSKELQLLKQKKSSNVYYGLIRVK